MQATYDETARAAILDKEIGNYARRGYRVITRTPTTAQLVKPKVFSRLWAIIWLCVAVAGILVYLAWYLAKRDSQVYLSVEANGKIRRS